MKREKYNEIECKLKAVESEREEGYSCDLEKNLEAIAANARASVEMEGLSPSKEAEEISKRFLKGEMSDEEAKRKILEFHGEMNK
jgi:hypothetical protein